MKYVSQAKYLSLIFHYSAWSFCTTYIPLPLLCFFPTMIFFPWIAPPQFISRIMGSRWLLRYLLFTTWPHFPKKIAQGRNKSWNHTFFRDIITFFTAKLARPYNFQMLDNDEWVQGPLLKNGKKYMSEDIGCNILVVR